MVRKNDVEELQEKVVRYFCDKPSNFPTGRPYNCCESVLLALADYLDVESELIPKIGTAIDAGVSLNGLLCGSISGAAMAIGLKYERDSMGWWKLWMFFLYFFLFFGYVMFCPQFGHTSH